MTKRFTDIELIEGCQKGDKLCERALVDSYADNLYATAIRYMGDRDEAKDIVQDAFIRIFKATKNFDPEKGSLKGWMQKICVNVALKKLNKRKFDTPLDDMLVEPQISAKAIENLEVETVYEVIQQLPEKQRTVFNLHVVEGYAHQEIADLLNIQIGSSRSILSRAKEVLRNKLMILKRQEVWI